MEIGEAKMMTYEEFKKDMQRLSRDRWIRFNLPGCTIEAKVQWNECDFLTILVVDRDSFAYEKNSVGCTARLENMNKGLPLGS